VPGGSFDVADARVNRALRLISRLEADLLRLKKYAAPFSGSSQMLLETKDRASGILLEMPQPETDREVETQSGTGTATEPQSVRTLAELPAVFNSHPLAPVTPQSTPEPQSIVDWAQQALSVTLDDHQRRLVTDPSNRVLMLAARQTGKSTAAAVKAMYEAVHTPNATIVLASPSGRQSGQIMMKTKGIALRLGLKLGPPAPDCDGFTLPNGSQIVSIPGKGDTVRGFSDPKLIIIDEAAFASDQLFPALFPMTAVSGGAIVLISTPNGQSGYFYEQWHQQTGPWSRHKLAASECKRLKPEALEQIRLTMSADEYAQEFECQFVAGAGQIISRELFRSSLRDDIDPFFPEYDALKS
jgi:hypothetical protein